MPSVSFNRWATARTADLDEIENAHRSVGGTGRGRRYATQQINQAYAVLLSSQFQGFCRDLHSECADRLAAHVMPAAFRPTLLTVLTQGRQLDRGNPNPDRIKSDFARFGIEIWSSVVALDKRNEGRQTRLRELNQWRNAIAHQQFDPAKLGGQTTVALHDVRQWRRACEALALAFDGAMQGFIQKITGVSPW